MRTISEELTIGLKELGVPQTGSVLYCAGSAFTLDEILDMLPPTIEAMPGCADRDDLAIKQDHNLVMMKLRNSPQSKYYFCYECQEVTTCGHSCECCDDDEQDIVSFSNINPAEAAGQLLAWCIGHKHINFQKEEK